MNNELKKILGIICILAGLIFLFIPIIPSFTLIITGLGLLGHHVHILRKKGSSK